eukprot:TRINITY_DN7659_c0_g1_i1.p1 TRINITY_DN7659_c0_g1~~TRINITY_DN7659_c0_g1_i1.p1  ORF type:complete len:254 (-),score=14.40 TRINITY_DN7659_c0_g1_i1:56-817(-)
MLAEVVNFINQSGNHCVLSETERDILNIAYRNVIASKRNSIRKVQRYHQHLNFTNVDKHKEAMASEYILKIEKELLDICTEAIKLIDKLVAHDQSADSQIFFGKLKGDYYRYLAEYTTSPKEQQQRKESSSKSLDCYHAALELARKNYPASDPSILGLILNLSVLYYDIFQDVGKAIELANQAFSEAVPGLQHVQSDHFNSATVILQLIRDNLTLWTEEKNSASKKTVPSSSSCQSTTATATTSPSLPTEKKD